jgi:hypothetical protein
MAGLFDAAKPLPIPSLGDVVVMAQSEKVPFQRLVKRGKKPIQMLHSWPVENVPDRAVAGTLDGADVSSYSNNSRGKLEVYGQMIRTAGWQVGRIAQATLDAGVADEAARQARIDGLILAQMAEKVLLSTQETALEASPQAYQLRGVFKWLQTGAQAVNPVPSAYRPTSAMNHTSALSGLTDTAFETMLAAAAAQVKEPVDLYGIVGTTLKRQMSLWGQKVTQSGETEEYVVRTNIDAKEKRLLQVIDVFEFDSGIVFTVPSFYLAFELTTGASTAYTAKSGIFINRDLWNIAHIQEPKAWTNPDTGGGPRGYHDQISHLLCLNPMGQLMVLTNT